jgi:hypothetical protein
VGTVFARFSSPSALVSYLLMPIDDPRVLDEKDSIYRELFLLARRRVGELPSVLIWLGLWPGLNHSFREVLRKFEKLDEEDLAQQGSDIVCLAIQKMDLTRVNRLAATMTWRLYRDLVRYCLKEVLALRVIQKRSGGEAISAALFGDAGLTEDDIRALLVRELGQDNGEFFFEVVFLEEEQVVAGARRGWGPEASWKKYQRIIERLKKEI